MDKLSKYAFLIVLILPVLAVLTALWYFLGGQRVTGGVAQGYFDGLSIMIIPTIFAVGLGVLIKHHFFNKH